MYPYDAARSAIPLADLEGEPWQLASLWDRSVAAGVDTFAWGMPIAFLYALVMSSVERLIVPSTDPRFADRTRIDWSTFPAAVEPIIPFLVIAFAVLWVTEAYGWSPGKDIMRLRVVRLDGRHPGMLHGLTRAALKAVGIAILWGAGSRLPGGLLVGAVYFSAIYGWSFRDRRNMGLHDHAARTVAVDSWLGRPPLRRSWLPISSPLAMGRRSVAIALASGAAVVAGFVALGAA